MTTKTETATSRGNTCCGGARSTAEPTPPPKATDQPTAGQRPATAAVVKNATSKGCCCG